jgi:hypothetical protein
MTMNVTRKTRVFGIVVLTALVLQKSLAGESSREADGARLLATPHMLPASGTHLGPYEILAPIGAGGMGEIYRSFLRR